jgi:hypothetical protein
VKGNALRALLTSLSASLAIWAGLLMAAPPAASASSPAAYCDEHFFEYVTTGNRIVEAYWVPMRYLDAQGQPQLVGFPIESRQGCISTLARGLSDGAVDAARFSLPAASSQCEYLEETFGITYPLVLYGQYTARNRTQCAHILQELLAVMPPPTNGPPL